MSARFARVPGCAQIWRGEIARSLRSRAWLRTELARGAAHRRGLPRPRTPAAYGFRFGCSRVLGLLALRNDASRACRVEFPYRRQQAATSPPRTTRSPIGHCSGRGALRFNRCRGAALPLLIIYRLTPSRALATTHASQARPALRLPHRKGADLLASLWALAQILPLRTDVILHGLAMRAQILQCAVLGWGWGPPSPACGGAAGAFVSPSALATIVMCLHAALVRIRVALGCPSLLGLPVLFGSYVPVALVGLLRPVCCRARHQARPYSGLSLRSAHRLSLRSVFVG